MAKEEMKNTEEKQEKDTQTEEQQQSANENDQSEQKSSEEEAEPEKSETEKLQEELAEMKDKYLRLYSEFENYRRRTAKEKLDTVKTANQDLLLTILPVLDDFERAEKSMKDSEDIDAVKEGIDLIYNKLFRSLESKGLKPMESSVGEKFDDEKHEAITQSPAPSDDLKGKIIDEIEKGYYLNDKILRFAKVIIGS